METNTHSAQLNEQELEALRQNTMSMARTKTEELNRQIALCRRYGIQTNLWFVQTEERDYVEVSFK